MNGGIARGEALGKEYVDKHYHQPSDEWSPSWDFTGMAEDVQLLHNLGRDLANSRDWPNWSDGQRIPRDARQVGGGAFGRRAGNGFGSEEGRARLRFALEQALEEE